MEQKNFSDRLNWLRAGVLGANDGIVSTAGIVVGVAGATAQESTLLLAGLSGLLAGSLSMAAGEYVSVSTQRDTERAFLATERRELEDEPEEELDELTQAYVDKGLTPKVARQVALELTARDPLAAHAAMEAGVDPYGLANPWEAALASFVAFTVGALLPLLAIVLPPPSVRVWVTVVAVVIGLVICGWTSARLGGAPPGRAVLRNVLGGLIAMAITYVAGSLIGA
ncbi:VIT1/CCC1 transporter family protein [Actinomadura harenae]|uniref:VIT family protein n=1 Tax=Actinomadura harenae TaxID=2483351 RepID=A0A3M2LUB5_9ACTN|nr:VIT family protein [Actinomadura harenae]RMI41071.1 VIT family protein [Actinomadura harenae]